MGELDENGGAYNVVACEVQKGCTPLFVGDTEDVNTAVLALGADFADTHPLGLEPRPVVGN
jgi:hypothetical protein